MVMKFGVEQKGTQFLVVNETTGDVKGRFREKNDADILRDELQRRHEAGVQQVSGRTTPPQQ